MDDYVLVAKDKHGYNVEQVRVCNLILKILENCCTALQAQKGHQGEHLTLALNSSCMASGIACGHIWTMMILHHRAKSGFSLGAPLLVVAKSVQYYF